MNNIYKNAEGYPDYVAGEAIKAADKQPRMSVISLRLVKESPINSAVKLRGE